MTTTTARTDARRVTIFFSTGDEMWHYRVQATNWRTLEVSEGRRQKRSIERAVARAYPGVEVVEV